MLLSAVTESITANKVMRSAKENNINNVETIGARK